MGVSNLELVSQMKRGTFFEYVLISSPVPPGQASFYHTQRLD